MLMRTGVVGQRNGLCLCQFAVEVLVHGVLVGVAEQDILHLDVQVEHALVHIQRVNSLQQLKAKTGAKVLQV